jgi:hypothetical protein
MCKAPLAKSKEEKCVTRWCRNRKAAKVTVYRKKDGTIVRYDNFLNHCWKCRARMFKERRPLTYVLNMIRNRARQRGIPFTITLPEFEKFCQETNYLELRGHFAGGLSIDRKDHDKGYHIWNIQVMEFEQNCTNGHVVPGKDCKQNEPKPEEYDYDFSGPDPDYVPPTDPDEPF